MLFCTFGMEQIIVEQQKASFHQLPWQLHMLSCPLMHLPGKVEPAQATLHSR